jgi:hypothetical protein
MLLLVRLALAFVFQKSQDPTEWFEQAFGVESLGVVPGGDDAVVLAALCYYQGRQVKHSILRSAFVGDAAPSATGHHPSADPKRW